MGKKKVEDKELWWTWVGGGWRCLRGSKVGGGEAEARGVCGRPAAVKEGKTSWRVRQKGQQQRAAATPALPEANLSNVSECWCRAIRANMRRPRQAPQPRHDSAHVCSCARQREHTPTTPLLQTVFVRSLIQHEQQARAELRHSVVFLQNYTRGQVHEL